MDPRPDLTNKNGEFAKDSLGIASKLAKHQFQRCEFGGICSKLTAISNDFISNDE
jgi:hypothetical protein